MQLTIVAEQQLWLSLNEVMNSLEGLFGLGENDLLYNSHYVEKQGEIGFAESSFGGFTAFLL